MAVVENEKRYTDPLNPDAHFDLLFYGDDYSSLHGPIPRVAHFVHTNTEPLNWIIYLAVRGAIVNLRVEKVKIWIPQDSKPEGEIWEKVATMPLVELFPIEMPRSVYGVKIEDAAGKADVVRLKVLYEEGGIFLENDLVALRPIDSILDDPDVRPTVMAERMAPEGVPNWLVISKPRSPFLRRWMEEYAEEKDWNSLATQTPLEFLRDHDPHLQVLNGRSWFYPLASDIDGDASLKKLWLGKSWYDIDESYGTHVWHWMEEFRDLLTPDLVRTIDTPLFCRLRPLLNGVGGKKSKPWQKDPNCAIIHTSALDRANNGLFADYAMDDDKNPIKLLDSSGHNLHGWAPNGTAHARSGYSNVRSFGQRSFAVLPVPLEWDVRTFTLQISLRIDPSSFSSQNSTAFLKIRMEKEEEVLIQFKPPSSSDSKTINNNGNEGLALDLHWEPATHSTSPSKNQQNDKISWLSPPTSTLSPLLSSLHTLTLSFDRARTGRIILFLDNELIGENDLPLIHSPRFAQDIWLNARSWDELDMGFRGDIARLTVWADAIPKENLTTTMAEGVARGRGVVGVGAFNGGLGFRGSTGHYAGQEYLLSLMIFVLVSILVMRFWGHIVREGRVIGRLGKDRVARYLGRG